MFLLLLTITFLCGSAPNGAGGVDQLLGDLYVMLVRESNAVLNSMFSTTMVDREKAELEQSPLIDDVVRYCYISILLLLS